MPKETEFCLDNNDHSEITVILVISRKAFNQKSL